MRPDTPLSAIWKKKTEKRIHITHKYVNLTLVYVLLGISPASNCSWPTFQNPVSVPSANYNLTPGKYPKEHIQYSNHGESLKSRNLTLLLCCESWWFSMDLTKSRDRTALKWNPSSNSVDFKYFIPLMQGRQSYRRNMEMDSFPTMHLFHTLYAENAQKLTELWFL